MRRITADKTFYGGDKSGDAAFHIGGSATV
jgi:hypothetical protein